jgi:pimeloyl-ACP methyl ester carboxylesterase
MERHQLSIHGHTVSYQAAGTGPVIVLVHGITGSSAQWEPVAEWLTDRFTVIAPDLLGHGLSAKPRGDYSLGAYATGIRDLLVAAGHQQATIVGHSLGGGVAMQFAYQFPERCQRLVLVASGGLGREVHALLRAATLPGAELVLPLLTQRRFADAGRAVGRALRWLKLKPSFDLAEMGRGYASLAEPQARLAFIHTLRAVMDPSGQRVDATDRLYLAKHVPALIVWGERDPIIPVSHGWRAHEAMPGSRLEIFAGAGHFPHMDQPAGFARIMQEFMSSFPPAEVAADSLRDEILARAALG